MSSNLIPGTSSDPASSSDCEAEPPIVSADSGDVLAREPFAINGPAGGPDWADPVDGAVGGIGGTLHPSTDHPSTGRSRPRDRYPGHVVVLLPALNEALGVGHVIDGIPTERLRTWGYDVSVWVIDGHSTDATMDIARARGARTFVQSGRGKGNGVRQALTHLLTEPKARRSGDDRLFVMLDADGTYPVEDIPTFVRALEAGEEVVLGSRLTGSISDGAISDLNLLGNRLLSALARFLFRVPVTDVCTGMWGFREDAVRRFGLVAEGFDLEADLFASACEERVRLRELPISYRCRIGDPKMVPLRTGIAIAWRLLLRRINGPVAGRRPTRAPSVRSREETA